MSKPDPVKPHSTTFSLGICMAGAVSAGAYSAGVMDYLIEALDRWDSAKGTEGIPRHRVTLSVLGGASAGGMTTLVAAAAFANAFPPVRASSFDPALAARNKFYDTWVNLTGEDDIIKSLLGTSDILELPASSLLNSNFINEVANRIIRIDCDQLIKRPYVDSDLELFMTLSNVNGIPYELGFRSNASAGQWYRTRAHDDIAHFRLNDVEYQNDGRIPLSLKDNVNVELAKACAMATGAFPLGLSARIISRENKYLQQNPFINRQYPNPLVRLADDPVQSLLVDGGLINNEPFEITRTILLQKTGENIACEKALREGKEDPNKNHNHFRSTVLLVDPFPTEDAQPGELSTSLLSMAGHVYNTMRSQLLFKRDDIEAAMSENDFSRFMIAPKKQIYGEDIQGDRAIACGSLGGFGGFLDKTFRIHDFFLGRRNCQWFLRESFTVPTSTQNEIFMEGYRNVPPDKFRNSKGDYQIIPVLDDEPQEFPRDGGWPVYDVKKLSQYSGLLKTRLEKVAFSLMKDVHWLNKSLAFIGSRVLLRRSAVKHINRKIRNDLTDHKLTGPDVSL